MTTEEKKAALIKASVRVRSNASDETIDELYENAFLGSGVGPTGHDGEDGESGLGDIEPVEDVVSVEVESAKPYTATDVLEAFSRFRKEHGTNQLGPLTPAVFEWANANLPAAEWNKIYAGKRYDGEILQPKA